MAENVRGQKNTIDEFEERGSKQVDDTSLREVGAVNEVRLKPGEKPPNDGKEIKRQEGIEGRVD